MVIYFNRSKMYHGINFEEEYSEDEDYYSDESNERMNLRYPTTNKTIQASLILNGVALLLFALVNLFAIFIYYKKLIS
jgi:hypothetical protein